MGELFSDLSKWIWLDDVPKTNCYLQFRRSFVCREEEAAELCITAEGQYAVFVNGRYVPSTQYPDYPHYKCVQRIALASFLKENVNLLEIQVLYPGRDSAVARREAPGLRFELRQGGFLLCASGSGTEASLMEGYVSGEVPLVTPQLGYGFIYENPRPAVWRQAAEVQKECVFAERPVRELEQGPGCAVRLMSQGIFTRHESGLSQYAGFHFRELSDLADVQETHLPSADGVHFSSSEGDGIYLFLDLGEETAGYLEMDLTCPAPAPVDISYGEHLEDLRVRSDVGGRHFTFRWEAPERRNRFIHRFHRLGARYLQLLIYSPEVTVYYAGLHTAAYPFQADGSFVCSDHLHNRIYEAAKHTLRCCLHEHYEDCPWREQALYAFDSRNQMLFGYYAFGEFEQPRANLRLLALSQREDGLLELCAPARVNVNIPSFSLLFLVELEEYCLYSGDLAFGEEMLPVAARILHTFHEHVREGLMWNFPEIPYWNFYEWRPLLDAVPIERTEELSPRAEAPLQLFYLLALQRMARLCGYLGKETGGLEEEIRGLTEGLEQFWEPGKGAYASFLQDGRRVQCAELVQALALCAGAVPAERRRALRRQLSEGKLVPVSMSASIFRYEALLQEPEKYGVPVFEEIAERWGAMLYQGASTFWETDLGAEDFERAGSLCHAWSSVPIYLYGAFLLGVRPEEPGKWRVFDGVPSSVCAAAGRFPSPGGMVESRVGDHAGPQHGILSSSTWKMKDISNKKEV